MLSLLYFTITGYCYFTITLLLHFIITLLLQFEVLLFRRAHVCLPQYVRGVLVRTYENQVRSMVFCTVSLCMVEKGGTLRV